MSAYVTPLSQPYKIAKKSDILGRLEDGKLFDAFYDTEFTDLNRHFAEITEFGGSVRDLAGNLLYVADHDGKVSDYTVMSPFAWAIQRMHGKDDLTGDPQYILAGKIIQFFRYASHLDEAPFADNFLEMCREVKDKNSGRRFYHYPVLDEHGDVDWDSVRVSAGLKNFQYRDPQRNNKWIEKDIFAQAIGYNNINADDPQIWKCLHMACAENIFPTHLPRLKMARLDMLRVVEAAVAAGPKGENGLQRAYKKDPRTGEDVLSFSQGDFIKANTGVGNALRNVFEGFTMPDGSYVDFDQLHGAFMDAMALSGVMDGVRRPAPKIMSQMEKNTDWKHIAHILSGKQGSFGNHPIVSYVHKTYPYISGRMMTPIGTDQYRNNPKVALVYNLGVDPQSVSFNGKPFLKLEPEEYAQIIKSDKKNQNGTLKVVRLHHNPAILDEDTGFENGFNNGLEKPELQRRAKYLRDPEFIKNVMAGLRLANPKLGGVERLALPQPEEELFSFSTLEMHDPETGEDVQISRAQNHIEKAAQDARGAPIKIKNLWFKAIGPNHDVFINDFDSADAEEKAAEAFVKLIGKTNKKLSRIHGPLLPAPDDVVLDKKSAFAYRLKLLFHARQYFKKGLLQDIGHNFRVEDAHGHKLYEQEINEWDIRKLDAFRRSGNLNIVHEPLNVSVHIIDRIIEQLGYADLLGVEAKKRLEATKHLRNHGIPSLNGRDRWLTISEARKQLNKIKNNELMDEDITALEKYAPGVWTTFMTQHPDAQASLADYEKYLKEKEKRFPEFTDEHKILAGINMLTNAPLENFEYQVDADRIYKVSVPDRYLETPPVDPVHAKPLWLAPLTKTFNEKSLAAAIKADKDVVLVGEKLGKAFHLPRPVIVKPPHNGGLHSKFYRAAKARFIESGARFADNDNVVALFGEGPYEIHNMARPDPRAQTLHVPKTHFEGLLDEKIAGYKAKPCGMILRDEGLDIQKGRVRLLELDPLLDKPSGWEVGTSINYAKRLSLSQLGEMPDSAARLYGFNTTEEMISHFSVVFASFKINPKDQNSKVWVVNFDEIKPFDPENGTKFFKPDGIKTSMALPQYLELNLA